jgi:hypothetical protein
MALPDPCLRGTFFAWFGDNPSLHLGPVLPSLVRLTRLRSYLTW